ncbi:GbsR/MarR family transcriptional regulator [Amycolatopsis sp. NPDC059021]|uniref:GbsR/MarR family transcriptional regulator n=1 Tax=Amycolatopsis sp. NPDC059021 TaxID=3346704 RepID=UPI00366FD252
MTAVEEDALAQFVEDFASAMESTMPRMAGRIVAALHIADEPHLTATELGKRLNASSASISNMTRLLERQGIIERFVKPGIRRDLFRLTPMSSTNAMQDAVDSLLHIAKIAEGALRLPELAGRPAIGRLTETRDFYAFLAERVPALIEEFERTRTS